MRTVLLSTCKVTRKDFRRNKPTHFIIKEQYMKKLLVTLIAAGLVSTASAAGVHVEDGWARSTVEGMKMGGAFMKIHNDEAKQDFLVGGSSPVAERIEVHTHVNGYHVMFMGLKKPLKEGEKVPVTLKFKNAKPQTVQLEVKTAPQSGMDHGHGHGHGGAHQH